MNLASRWMITPTLRNPTTIGTVLKAQPLLDILKLTQPTSRIEKKIIFQIRLINNEISKEFIDLNDLSLLFFLLLSQHADCPEW